MSWCDYRDLGNFGATKPRAIYWEHEGNKAMRLGKWKIVSGGILHSGYWSWKTVTVLPWQLSDVHNNRCEMKALLAAHPELVSKIAAMWDAWDHKNNEGTQARRKIILHVYALGASRILRSEY